jgi:TolB-like protein/DNA-binding winged helix-turn-helix (wHTH) protein/tetratricopeptide (TPR) repeat protein
MTPMATTGETLRFADFVLDLSAYELRRQGRVVRLERRPMDLLVLLIQRRGQLVSRSDIVEQLWGKDVFVDVETGVNTVMWKVRAALHDSPEAPTFVETVPGKGYRFIAAVEVVPAPGAVVPLPAPSDARSKQEPVAAPTHSPTTLVPAPVESRSRVPLTGAIVAVVLLGAYVMWAGLGMDTPGPHVVLAVLPFENLSGDAEREYLADGLADETIAALGQIDPDHVSVIARTSTTVYKRTTKSVAQIGAELGANYLVESSIQAEGGRLRVRSSLILVRDQVHVWSGLYDSEPTSMLGLQRELSTVIAEQIRLRLSPERIGALARRQTRNPDAYHLYLRGRNFENQRTPATTLRAIDYYRRATDLDPNYALAWSGLAHTYSARSINSDVPPVEVAALAREAAASAVRTGPDLAEAQTSLGAFNFLLGWDWPAAEAALRRAIALDPNDPVAHSLLGHLLSQTGRHQEARSAMSRARAIDPLNAMSHAMSSQVAFQARDYAAALDHAHQGIVLDPEFWIGYVQSGQALEQLGRTEAAFDAFSNAARFSDFNSKAISLRGYLLGKAGRSREARDVLKALEEASPNRYVPPYAMALVYAGLEERDAVFEWLDRAYDAKDVHLIFLPVDPKWDPYRADPRFTALVARCDFARTASASPPGEVR